MFKLKKISQDENLKEAFATFVGTEEEGRTSYIPKLTILKIISFPFIKEKEGFLFYKGEKLIGRVLVTIDETFLRGFFTLFSCDKKEFLENPEEVKALWSQIEKWFYDKNTFEIIGPYFYTSFFPYRFRTDDLEAASDWEPHNPLYEYQIFKDFGFEDLESYFSNFSENFSPFLENGIKARENLLKLGYTYKYFDRQNLESDLKILFELSVLCFKDNFLFKEIPFELFKELYIPNLIGYDLSLAHMTLSPEGEVCAFHFNFKDQDNLVLKSICVHPSFRRLGIFNAGITESILKGKRIYTDLTRATAALVHDENTICKNAVLKEGPRSLHQYKLIKKEIKND